MTTNKKTPPIVQIGAWVLALFVFAVGFWHTHLGLKEMKPFSSEWGGLVIASIVLLLLLITYWFAVNGRKMALIFYILCGVIFFVCNLNYFYPAYMARTLVKEEADTLVKTIDNYSSNTIFKNSSYDKAESLQRLKEDYLKQVSTNFGQGTKALSALSQFNAILKDAGLPAVSSMNNVILSETEIEAQRKAMDESINAFAKKNVIDEIVDLGNVLEGYKNLADLKTNRAPLLKEIVVDDSPLKLDSIKFHPQVVLIKNTVSEINSAVTPFNKGSGSDVLPMLDKKSFPRADKLGEIQNTFITIGERINQISTWAIIILCLFIDLVVPLAIYLLLRKKGDEPENKSLQGKIKPTSF